MDKGLQIIVVKQIRQVLYWSQYNIVVPKETRQVYNLFQDLWNLFNAWKGDLPTRSSFAF